MYQPEDSLRVRAAHVLRLPFYFVTSLCADLLAQLARVLEAPIAKPVPARQGQPIAIRDAVRPFLSAFQQSIAEQAKSGRDSFWAAYDTQAKDAVQLTRQVSQPAWRWLRRCWTCVLSADWQTTRQMLTGSLKRLASWLSSLRPGAEQEWRSALADTARECEGVKVLFKAGKLSEAEKRYGELLQKLEQLQANHQDVRKEQVRILTNLALCQKKQDRFAEALASAAAARKLEAFNVKALFLHGSCLRSLGRTAEAIEDLALAVQREPLPDAKRQWLSARQALGKEADSFTQVEVLALLADATRVQLRSQEVISKLGQSLLQERGDCNLSFLAAHELVKGHSFPPEPLQEYGLTMQSFQDLIARYEDDMEVMQSAQNMLHPPGRGDPARARQMGLAQIVEAHQAMVAALSGMLDELRVMDPQMAAKKLDYALIETTAELLTYLAVARLGVRPEDVEEAIIAKEMQLQDDPDFAKHSEELAVLMQQLLDFSSMLRGLS